MATLTLAQWQQSGRYFEYRGQPIFYQLAGDGEALLLLHGFPTASWDFHHQWSELAARFKVIAPDFIGFGFSAKPRDYTYSLMDQADLVCALLAEQGIQRCHVLAHDYGVSVGQELLARHAEGQLEIASMCFLNGGLFPEMHRPVLTQKLLHSPLGALVGRLMSERTFNRSFAKVFGPKTQPSAEELKEFWSLMLAGDDFRRVAHKLIRYIDDRAQHRDRWVNTLLQPQVPIALINGPEDPVSGAHLVAHYQQAVPDVAVTSLPGIGHYPQVEAPAEVLVAYLAFVERYTNANV